MTESDPLAQIHVVRRGSGTPVVFLHGNGVDHRCLLPLDPAVERSGDFERIHVDLPGFGGSAPLEGDGGLPALCAWAAEALPALTSGRDFLLIANSMGAAPARHVVAERPERVRGMALIAPLVHPESDRRTLPDPVRLEEDPGLRDGIEEKDWKLFTDVSALYTREAWDAFEAYALPGLRAADGGAMSALSEDYHLAMSEDDMTSDPEFPVLVVAARQDHIVGYRDQFDLALTYPRGSYVLVDGAGHNVHLDRPAQVEGALETWLRRVDV